MAELLVVFLGVWLGLLADTYRESRQEREAEQVSLDRLVRDLETDQLELEDNLRTSAEGLAAAGWLLERADSAGTDRDSVEHYLTQLQEAAILSANTSEYAALKNAGRINIIRNADLRQRFTQLYESYPFVQQLHERDNTWLQEALGSIAPYVRVGHPLVDFPDVSYGAVTLVGNARDVLGQSDFLLAVARLELIRSILEARYEDLLNEARELRVSALGELGR